MNWYVISHFPFPRYHLPVPPSTWTDQKFVGRPMPQLSSSMGPMKEWPSSLSGCRSSNLISNSRIPNLTRSKDGEYQMDSAGLITFFFSCLLLPSNMSLFFFIPPYTLLFYVLTFLLGTHTTVEFLYCLMSRTLEIQSYNLQTWRALRKHRKVYGIITLTNYVSNIPCLHSQDEF